MTLSKWLLFKVALRSFLLQASWNYRGMMSMGFLYSIAPGLDHIYEDKNERELAYMRHFEYFNTNPYFSSIVMGVTLSLEEKYKNGDNKVDPEIIHNTKEALMTSLAAIGDGFFWDSWRPFVAVFAIVFAAANYSFVPFLFLILYNLPHLYFRFAGIYWGYEDGMNVIRKLKGFKIPQIRQTLRMGTLVLLAYLIPNNVSVKTPFYIKVMEYIQDLSAKKISLEYGIFFNKIVQGVIALLLVSLGTFAYRKKVNVLLISFLLLILALMFYHWGIFI